MPDKQPGLLCRGQEGSWVQKMKGEHEASVASVPRKQSAVLCRGEKASWVSTEEGHEHLLAFMSGKQPGLLRRGEEWGRGW